jgi:phospholipase C
MILPSFRGVHYNDINNCGLQSVSWVIPDGNWSDHAGGNAASAGGPSWVAAIVNAVGSNTACDTTNGKRGYWYDTVILVVWDDWGGFYDDVPPPAIGYSNQTGSQYVYGFRVPLLVVSAYTKYTGTCSPGGGPCVGYISGPTTNATCSSGKLLLPRLRQHSEFY